MKRTPKTSRRVYSSEPKLNLPQLLAAADQLFDGDTTAARHWMRSPQYGLGGKIPNKHASTKKGAKEVERLIGRIRYGVLS
ncbi:MAG TPA: MbcA/ParS/Xre antitoxin family protein [Phycisphaerae bacterium]|jgi:putative toxin-antitoxin system antitoxin component (TIGR02293 family)